MARVNNSVVTEESFQELKMINFEKKIVVRQFLHNKKKKNNCIFKKYLYNIFINRQRKKKN